MTEDNRMASTGSSNMHEDRPYAPEDIVQWVHEQITRSCAKVELRQRADEGELLICTINLPGGNAHAIAAGLYSRSMSEGRYLRGPTLFFMYAFKDGSREHCDRKSFRVEGEAFTKTGETEPATLLGINSMLMRHTDAATKIALGHTSHIIEQYKVLLQQRDQRIAALETAMREASAMRESLVMLDHERALALHRSREDEKRSDFMRDKLDMLIPVLAGKMLGTTSMGVPPIVTDAMLKKLLGSLTPEQMQKLTSILSYEQQAVVGDLYMRYAQQSKDPNVAAAANAQAGAHPPGSSNGQQG